ncbi:coenzyme gamma-F420-2:alpha-L-glutamate ligase [Methanococcus voltae]|uniref:Coenzyme gamma-F420-2:alpha-L-glutamate ligase n=1 Tax=Methanococcus voltae (strain ATCC BAA-1334 / A3) TaxID=456320 RepID=D7DQI3_METV3|nr:coenzyme gamma-F420-2:alpha-L-glutamate ligase [Methanococcus voltae]MCS3901655.1 gamma-F420-2:alpha-L-glutamate ligase [Methanococcus voltae]
MITIVCAEGGSTIYALKNAIKELGQPCKILLLSEDNLLVDDNYKIDTDLIHSRCGIGDYMDRLTLYSWQVLKNLEEENYKFVNSLSTIYNSSDKFKTLKILNKNGIKVPKTALIRDYGDAIRFIEKYDIKYPLILKNSFSKCGMRVDKPLNNEELKEKTKNSMWESKLIQEYIDFKDQNTGLYKDMRVLVVDGQVVGGYRRISNDYITNLYKGGSIEELKINSDVEEIALKCSEVMKGDIMAVDLLPKNDEYNVVEVNTAPGTKGFRQLGINADEIIAKCLIDRMKR